MDAAIVVDAVWTKNEIEWFQRNSYDLALKYYDQWSFSPAVRLLEASLHVRAMSMSTQIR